MSRYLIEQKRDGFIIRGQPNRFDVPGAPKWLKELGPEDYWQREPVSVTLKPYCLEVASSGETKTVGFFDFPPLVAESAVRLMAPWRPPVREHEGPDEEQYAPYWASDWAMKRTQWAINKQLHAEWQRLLGQVDPTVLAVHKKVFAATWNCQKAPLLSEDALYKEKYIVRDILSYRAAAVATLACDEFGPPNESSIQKMRHWRDLFAPAGMGAYTTLNKTLMNLPGGIPASLLADLRQLVLPRPIYNRLELATTIVAGARTADNFHVFAHATADEIKEAMRRISVSLQRQEEAALVETMPRYTRLGRQRFGLPTALSSRRTKDIRTAVYYMLDFPEDHRGRLAGLAEKAIRWHGAEGREQEARKTIKRFGTERALALPPIPLPEVPGIHLLKTVGDAVAEGERMQHCIASYSEKAVEGRCFLFHVEYQAETASVEVSHTGAVIQARGPRNNSNKATQWGARLLQEWGRGFGDEEARKAFAQTATNIEELNERFGVPHRQSVGRAIPIACDGNQLADDNFLRELMAM